MLETPPLSLYIHIPWCIRKCPYCDFNSHVATAELPEAEYVAALCEDLDRDLELTGKRTIESIFIGGGTPSLFSAKAFEKIFSHIDKRVSISSTAEITLEANPGTAETGRFKDYLLAGINRLSIGVQSFNDEHLNKLGRVHNAEQASAAITIAKSAGFENLNLDLMHGLPQQTVEQALSDLQQAFAFEPNHVSWYQLTVEPNTVFYSKPPRLPLDSVMEEIQELGLNLLAGAGYERYEVSAFAHSAKQSAHNMNYWQFGDYLGIGAGAHGKISFPEENKIIRTRKLIQPEHYLRNSIGRTAKTESVVEAERPLEFLLNALRVKQGFTVSTFESRTGLPFSIIRKKVEYLKSKSLLLQEDGYISATDKGYLVLNSLLEEFL